MQTVLVLSGGTGTAWSICSAIRSVVGMTVKLIVADTNPPWLVHTSTLADEFIQVPPILSSDYYNRMLSLFETNHVDKVIPLIDWDIQLFAGDNPDLLVRRIMSTAPVVDTFKALSDKKMLYKTLSGLGVPSPRLLSVDELDEEKDYFVKPSIGFGSRGAFKASGMEIKKQNLENCIIQELCSDPEITVDIFSNKSQACCICRERIEVKAGVCTKSRIFSDTTIEEYIRKISKEILLPTASCAQFMKGVNGQWQLTDFNLRLGAGSALSAAVNFKLAEAAVATWMRCPEKIVLDVIKKEHFVVRHYMEVVTQ